MVRCIGSAYFLLPVCPDGRGHKLRNCAFHEKQQLAVVSALVGAGGNLGAVIAGFAFYKPISDPLLPFQVHAAYVLFWTLLTPCYYWKEHGGMFHGPAVEFATEKAENTA